MEGVKNPEKRSQWEEGVCLKRGSSWINETIDEMKVELEFTEGQMNEVAKAMILEMEAQGKVMVAPERTKPFSVTECADEFGVSTRTIHNWVPSRGMEWHCVSSRYSKYFIFPS